MSRKHTMLLAIGISLAAGAGAAGTADYRFGSWNKQSGNWENLHQVFKNLQTRGNPKAVGSVLAVQECGLPPKYKELRLAKTANGELVQEYLYKPGHQDWYLYWLKVSDQKGAKHLCIVSSIQADWFDILPAPKHENKIESDGRPVLAVCVEKKTCFVSAHAGSFGPKGQKKNDAGNILLDVATYFSDRKITQYAVGADLNRSIPTTLDKYIADKARLMESTKYATHQAGNALDYFYLGAGQQYADYTVNVVGIGGADHQAIFLEPMTDDEMKVATPRGKKKD